MRQPDARPNRYSNKADLPTPASPRTTSTELWPVRTVATTRSSASHSLRLPRSSRPASMLGILTEERMPSERCLQCYDRRRCPVLVVTERMLNGRDSESQKRKARHEDRG